MTVVGGSSPSDESKQFDPKKGGRPSGMQRAVGFVGLAKKK